MEDTIKEETIDAGQDENVFSFVDGNIPAPDNKTLFNYGNEADGGQEDESEESETPVEEPQEEASVEDTNLEIKDVPNKENPSRFEFWQSKFTQEQNARKELENKIHEFENKMESFTKPPQEKPEELKAPVKPNSDEPLEILKYLEDKNEYLEKVISKIDGGLKAREQAEQKAKEQAQFKAFIVGAYQQNGADQNLSMEAYNFFTSEQSLDPKTQLEMYKAYKNGSSQPDKKTDQIKTKGDKFKIPLPLGVVSGQQVKPKEANFGDDLVNYYKNNRIL